MGFCSFQYDTKRFLFLLCTLLDLPIIDGRHPVLSFETVFIIYHATGWAFNTHLKMFNMFKKCLFFLWFFVVLRCKICTKKWASDSSPPFFKHTKNSHEFKLWISSNFFRQIIEGQVVSKYIQQSCCQTYLAGKSQVN